MTDEGPGTGWEAVGRWAQKPRPAAITGIRYPAKGGAVPGFAEAELDARFPDGGEYTLRVSAGNCRGLVANVVPDPARPSGWKPGWHWVQFSEAAARTSLRNGSQFSAIVMEPRCRTAAEVIATRRGRPAGFLDVARVEGARAVAPPCRAEDERLEHEETARLAAMWQEASKEGKG